MSVRALKLGAGGTVQLAPSAPATSSFVIAPVDAPGKIVYWALADDMGSKVGSLKGFGIGEESVEDVLVPSQVQTRAADDTCVGCHTATPGRQLGRVHDGPAELPQPDGECDGGFGGDDAQRTPPRRR